MTIIIIITIILHGNHYNIIIIIKVLYIVKFGSKES